MPSKLRQPPLEWDILVRKALAEWEPFQWAEEPLSVEKLYANPHYRRWARENCNLRTLTQLLITARRKEGHQETRDEMFKAIAKLLGVDNWKTIKYAANRSSKVIPKRRQQI